MIVPSQARRKDTKSAGDVKLGPSVLLRSFSPSVPSALRSFSPSQQMRNVCCKGDAATLPVTNGDAEVQPVTNGDAEWEPGFGHSLSTGYCR